MKVIKDFYCVIEKKAYVKGEDYTGKRDNLTAYVDYGKPIKDIKVDAEPVKEDKRKKRNIEKK